MKYIYDNYPRKLDLKTTGLMMLSFGMLLFVSSIIFDFKTYSRWLAIIIMLIADGFLLMHSKKYNLNKNIKNGMTLATVILVAGGILFYLITSGY